MSFVANAVKRNRLTTVVPASATHRSAHDMTMRASSALISSLSSSLKVVDYCKKRSFSPIAPRDTFGKKCLKSAAYVVPVCDYKLLVQHMTGP